MLIFIFINHFILPQLANADLQDIHDRRESAVMAATTDLEDEGYKRECERTTNSQEEYSACAQKFNALIAQKAKERAEEKAQKEAAGKHMPYGGDGEEELDPSICERDAVISKCQSSFAKAQKDFSDSNVQQCRSYCYSTVYWIEKRIYGCGNFTKKKIKEKLDFNYKFCATPTPNIDIGARKWDSNLENTFDEQAKAINSGMTNMHIERVQDPVQTSMNSESTDCIKSNIDTSAPALCAHITKAIGGYEATEYYYTDRMGNKFNNIAAAVQSNNSIQGPFQPSSVQTADENARFGTSRGIAGVSAELDEKDQDRSGSRTGSLKPAANTQAADRMSGSAADSTTDNNGSDPLASTDNQNTQTASVPSSGSDGSGSSSLGGGSSSYGDASMFPSLQSAKSYKSSDETTGGSSLSNFRGSGASASDNGSSSYSGGTGFKSTNSLNGKSSEVAGGGRVYAPSGVISGKGSNGIGMAGSSGNQGVAVASVSPNNEDSQRVLRIGDQGFYKPGGSAAGGGVGSASGKYAGRKNARRKKLKSVGRCAPGNIQCVLASLGGPVKGTRVGSRRGSGGGSRLPAGVTSGVEDIFSRVVRFHNYHITLDHEGMIDNSNEEYAGGK